MYRAQFSFGKLFKRTMGSFSKFWKNIHPCLGVVIERGIEIGTNISMEQKCGGNNIKTWIGKRKRQNRSDMFSVVKKTGRGSEMKSKEHTYQKK